MWWLMYVYAFLCVEKDLSKQTHSIQHSMDTAAGSRNFKGLFRFSGYVKNWFLLGLGNELSTFMGSLCVSVYLWLSQGCYT